MERKLDIIESDLQKKVLLYKDVVECLKRERKCLIEVDMDELWDVSMEKQTIVSDINTLRKRLLERVRDIVPEFHIEGKKSWFAQIIPYVPPDDRERFKNLYHTLMGLKMEIKTRSKENMSIIEDSIVVLDDIISIIANTGRSQVTYNGGCSLNGRPKDNILLHREA
ncbi:MAG: flagellar export chaperone FlgN [Pseudomonadota bacterium]